MSDGMGSGMGMTPADTQDHARLVKALFDSEEEAEAAREDLVEAGIPATDIAVEGAGAERAGSSLGFWESLKDLLMPAADRESYDEARRRGGFTVSVRVDTATHDRVMALLDRDGAVDLDEREQSWRNEGWTGYATPGFVADSRSEEPGTVVPQPEEEPTYRPPSDATAGFTASIADRFPTEEAPPIESPGALPEEERVATPDRSLASTLGLAPNPGAPAVPTTASGAGAVASDGSGRRDAATSRARLRSYSRDALPEAQRGGQV